MPLFRFVSKIFYTHIYLYSCISMYWLFLGILTISYRQIGRRSPSWSSHFWFPEWKITWWQNWSCWNTVLHSNTVHNKQVFSVVAICFPALYVWNKFFLPSTCCRSWKKKSQMFFHNQDLRWEDSWDGRRFLIILSMSKKWIYYIHYTSNNTKMNFDV